MADTDKSSETRFSETSDTDSDTDSDKVSTSEKGPDTDSDIKKSEPPTRLWTRARIRTRVETNSHVTVNIRFRHFFHICIYFISGTVELVPVVIILMNVHCFGYLRTFLDFGSIFEKVALL